MSHNVTYLCYRMRGGLTKDEAWLLTQHEEEDLYEFVKEQYKSEVELMASMRGMGL